MMSCLFQGKSMLDTCSKAFKNQQMTLLLDKLQCFHLPVVYGAICGIMELDIQSTLTTFLYSTLRTSIASSIRLDKVGPIEVNINYYYTLHIFFHNIKVIRQFRCFSKNLLMRETTWRTTQTYIMQRETTDCSPVYNT